MRLHRLSGLLGLLGLLGVLQDLLPAAHAWDHGCLPEDKAVGFGYKATGGAEGKRVVAKDPKHLVQLLGSKEKLIIDLDKEYDFTDWSGWKNVSGCFVYYCGDTGFIEALSEKNDCEDRRPTTVRYSVAGTVGIRVASHKTILSTNRKGAIKGTGLRLVNVTQVIVKDINITDINAHVYGGGDAIVLDRVKDVWIHKVKTARIGRHHLVSTRTVNTGVTVSSCRFQGETPYSWHCDKKHYWVMRFSGTYDEVTLINNDFKNASGMVPRVGGWKGAKNLIHIIGNEYDTNELSGIDPREGAFVLTEGNNFISYNQTYSSVSSGGKLAMIDSAGDAQQCKDVLKNTCLCNGYINTIPMVARLDVAVLKEFARLDRTAISGAREHAKRCLKTSDPAASTGKYSTLIRLLQRLRGMSFVFNLQLDGLRLLLPRLRKQ